MSTAKQRAHEALEKVFSLYMHPARPGSPAAVWLQEAHAAIDAIEERGPASMASDVIDLFLEYRDKHGYDEATAKAKAVCEVMDANLVHRCAPLSESAREKVREALVRWRARMARQRNEMDPPEEFIVDLMEDAITDLESALAEMEGE